MFRPLVFAVFLATPVIAQQVTTESKLAIPLKTMWGNVRQNAFDVFVVSESRAEDEVTHSFHRTIYSKRRGEITAAWRDLKTPHRCRGFVNSEHTVLFDFTQPVPRKLVDYKRATRTCEVLDFDKFITTGVAFHSVGNLHPHRQPASVEVGDSEGSPTLTYRFKSNNKQWGSEVLRGLDESCGVYTWHFDRNTELPRQLVCDHRITKDDRTRTMYRVAVMDIIYELHNLPSGQPMQLISRLETQGRRWNLAEAKKTDDLFELPVDHEYFRTTQLHWLRFGKEIDDSDFYEQWIESPAAIRAFANPKLVNVLPGY